MQSAISIVLGVLMIISNWFPFTTNTKKQEQIKPKKKIVVKVRPKLIAKKIPKKIIKWTHLKRVSNYSPGDSGSVDSEGRPVRVGLVAVGRGRFRQLYGKVIKIKEFPNQTFVVTDKMGADRDIDIWVSSSAKAKHWGVRDAHIRIVGQTKVSNWGTW